MAGITGFQPSASLSPTTPRLTNPLSSSSSSSSLFLPFSHKPNPRSRVLTIAITAAAPYGRSSGFRPGPRPGNSRRPPGDARNSDPDDDALNLSKIKSSSVRLIDEQQNMIGVVSKSEAIQMAEDAEQDLVILSADAEPPVLRIMDYNKYKYEQQKRKRDQQKKSTANRMDIKELKMGYNIDSHDYSVRLKAAQKFLKDGDKVKIIVNLKGRENEFRNIAIELIKRFQNDVGELATEESKSFRERNIFLVLVPNKTVLQKAQEQPKRKETSENEVSAVAN